jgi:DoxX-like protein
MYGMSVLHLVTLVLEGLMGAVTAFAAYSLITGKPASIARAHEVLNYPGWFWFLAKIVATIGAVGLFVGLVYPLVGAAAAAWMVAYFIVATGAHVVRKDMANLGMPIAFLVFAVGLVALRWGEATPILATVGL